MLKKLSWVLLLLFTYCSCSSNDYSFNEHESGLKFKVVKESESKININEGDFIELDLKYRTETDSVLFNSKEFGDPFKMQVGKISHLSGSFEEALLMMNPGDSYQFLIRTDSFYLKTKQEKLPISIRSSDNLLFDIKIIRKISSKEIEKERALFNKQMSEQEPIILKQYVEDEEIKQLPFESGLYYIEIESGKGIQALSGDILTVHYTGKLIDGKVFDSSYQRNEAFTFKIGANEVIPGWDEGFTYMKKGGKAVFIIPSKLAYGKEGYSTIIPSYASLIFEVELLSIKK